MRVRRKARILAMSILYSMEIQKTTDVAVGRLSLNFYKQPFKKNIIDLALKFVRGVIKNKDFIDDKISKQAKNWSFNRIAVVDKQIMRVTIFEVFYDPFTPPPVAINEAVDIAKMYSTHDSGHFVNGILDKICKKKK